MVKRVVYPPVWLAIGLAAVFAFNELMPGPRFTSVLSQGVGGVIIVVGLWLLVNAAGLFRRAGTELIPFKNVTALVTGGAYRFTRNPMYLGMLLVLLGCAVTVGAAYALAVPVVFAVVIEVRFIRPEEAMLRELFGAEFDAYCLKVRRWL